MTMNEDMYKSMTSAADFFNQTSRKLLATDGKLHAETLIISTARMAGSLLYRSFGFDATIAPGTVVMSDQANINGPKLMALMFTTLTQLGHKISEQDIDQTYSSSQFSQFGFQETQERLSLFFLKYCEASNISLQIGAFGAAIATAILIHDCRDVLNVEKGAAMAIYGFIEGTKTAS